MTRHDLVEINKLALKYFVRQLGQNNRVYAYLRGRLSEECVKRFRLGYAPYAGLVEFLQQANVNLADAVVLGLLGVNEDKSYYEVFGNRIIIPIIHAGLLVGFAGRTFEDKSKIKYINSKTSVLYRKNEVLFGLWYARRYIKESGFAVVLEGYFDWLALFSGGILNVVAVSGTALTDMHCTMLKRYTSDLGIMFDGDAIGLKKAGKMLGVAEERGMNAHLLSLPKDTDPDEYLAGSGLDAMQELISSGMHI